MKQRKVFAFLLALAVLVGVLPMAAAAIDAPLRRSELVAGLWEAAGSPAPTLAETPFADVDKNAAYYSAVLWAAETGLTDGTGGGKFSPDDEVSSAQAVAGGVARAAHATRPHRTAASLACFTIRAPRQPSSYAI